MNISEKVNQEQLQEILLNIYHKGIENENISVEALIEDIKHELMSAAKK
jgi:hypothetical protein